jgi:hypothetical protein
MPAQKSLPNDGSAGKKNKRKATSHTTKGGAAAATTTTTKTAFHYTGSPPNRLYCLDSMKAPMTTTV